MTVILDRGYGAGEERALAELQSDGFAGATKVYAPGMTEPHCHDQDLRLYVLEGEILVTEIDKQIVHTAGPGDRLSVPAGTRHSEDHGDLRMVVGRR